MTAAGLIFANIHDGSLPELTRVRNTASVPFGGRYRLIDFTLSNMVNSGVTRVGVVTHYNYQSLLDHLGTGKDWDLARRAGGLKLIPPNLTASGAGHLPTSRLESMLSALDYITHCTEDCLVLSDCDIICNIDLSEVIAAHAASGADITFVTKRVDASRMYLAEQVACITTDSDGRVTEFAMRQPTEGVVDLYTNIMVVRRQYLLQVLADAAAFTAVEDGSLALGNLMNAAHSLGIASCWIHRAREVFASAEGKALLQQWGVEGEWIGIGHCILGYAAEPEKPAAPRLEGRIVRI